MDNNNRNLFLTIALSVLILTLWQIFYVNPQIEAERQTQLQEQAQIEAQAEADAASGLPAASPGTGSADIPQATVSGAAPTAESGAAAPDRETAVAAAERIAIDTPTLTGSINLSGARFDDLSLKLYHVEVDPSSPIVPLLSPVGAQDAYFAEFGYTGIEGAPGPDAQWQVDGNAVLTPETPVRLTFTAENGIGFAREIAVDDEYMFTITDEISNGAEGAVALQSYGRTTRYTKPAAPPIFILHEGMIGVTGEEGLTELTFNEIEGDGQEVPGKSNDGWLGITDKYWATALIPEQGMTFQPRYSFFTDGASRYQADFLIDPLTINAGQTATVTNMLFAGAKKTNIVDAYEADRGIRQFELLIDWGWFHFITKPLFHLLYWLNGVFGNFGVAILLATVLIKLIFFPLANKSYASMARMKVVQPKMAEIKERYGDDREKMQKAMMDLYKKEKINPIAGCWPVLIQIPVFFALYKVLYVTIEMRHAPFFGWVQDLSAPDPTSIFNLFGLLPFDPSVVPLLGPLLMVGVWPLLMGVTMFVQMQMNPPPPDPTTAMIFKWMPVVFTFMLATFPAGLVIYWAWNNFLSILQQGVIMKRHGAKIELWDNLKGMFNKKPKQPAE